MIDNNTTLIQIPSITNYQDLKKAIIANAYSIVDIGAKNKRNVFEQILGPINGKWDLDRPFKMWQENGQWKTQGVSTCGLVARGLWRRLKVDFPALYSPIVPGTVISAEISFANSVKPYGAYQIPTKDNSKLPSPGDYMIIGTGGGTHVLTVIDVNSNKITSVDGGQTDSSGLQCVKLVERTIKFQQNKMYLNSKYGDKIVQGWIMLNLLPIKNENITVPEGWNQ